MDFHQLKNQLIHCIRERIRNGELTERSLARAVGISQPHMHNVLKGTRMLSAELADALLQHLNSSILDLIDRSILGEYLERDEDGGISTLRVLEGRVGPGHPWPQSISEIHRFRTAARFVRRMQHAVAVQTGEDPEMRGVIGGDAWAILDQGEAARTKLNPEALYLLRRGESGIVRRARIVGQSIFIASEITRDKPDQWERVPMAHQDIQHVIRARVTLISRDVEWPVS